MRDESEPPTPNAQGPTPNRIRLRLAREADDPFFVEMEFRTTWHNLSPSDRARLSPDDVRGALQLTHELLLNRPGNQVVIAENEKGERVGLLWLGINRNVITGEDEAWVYNVSVAEGHQGRGIGRLLMEHAEKLARRAGFHTLGLMVASHNSRARSLYEKLSFETTNTLMRKKLE